jgi:hypothetical protein
MTEIQREEREKGLKENVLSERRKEKIRQKKKMQSDRIV